MALAACPIHAVVTTVVVLSRCTTTTVLTTAWRRWSAPPPLLPFHHHHRPLPQAPHPHCAPHHHCQLPRLPTSSNTLLSSNGSTAAWTWARPQGTHCHPTSFSCIAVFVDGLASQDSHNTCILLVRSVAMLPSEYTF